MIVGLCGRARSGKDTFAEMLAGELFNITGKKFVLMAYATELKLRVQRDFDLSYDQLWGNAKEVEDSRYLKDDGGYWTAREILQHYGQFYRSIDSNFWINNLFNVIHDKEYENVIITDVRHPNEATPVSDRNGCVIKVISNRPGMEQIHGTNHISETAMDDYTDIDFVVDNSSGLEELKASAVQVAKFIINLKK